jgi:hypothetical protein
VTSKVEFRLDHLFVRRVVFTVSNEKIHATQQPRAVGPANLGACDLPCPPDIPPILIETILGINKRLISLIVNSLPFFLLKLLFPGIPLPY